MPSAITILAANEGHRVWQAGWLPCPHCRHPYRVLDVWRGAQDSCSACGEILHPGRVERVADREGTVDVVTCPWCGAQQRWSALERVGLPERSQRVHYTCPDCLRPFVVEHDPTVVAQLAPAELSQRELEWFRFVRALVQRGLLER